AILVALCLIVLLAVAALAVDGGMLLDNRRRVQAAADAAALAAAADLFKNYPAYNGLDLTGTASAAGQTNAAANGCTDVTVNIPPASGIFAGKAGYAEVVISFYQPRYFSSIFGSEPVAVRARAVARGLWVNFNDGVIVLHPTQSGALSANGNGDVKVRNANIIDD